MRMTVDRFVKLKRQHGKLTYFTLGEDYDWQPWKHEFGFPEKYKLLMFEDGSVYNLTDEDADKEVF